MVDDLVAVRPEWREIVEQARRQGNTSGLPHPPGLPDERCSYALPWNIRADGTGRMQLRWQRKDPQRYPSGDRSWMIGTWTSAGSEIPLRNGRPKGQAPGAVEGRVVTCRNGLDEWRVVVTIDEHGLPVPVHEEAYNGK